MAFCTQRKFPGQSYENDGLAEINPMKGYNTIKDHRAWSIDQNQRTSYLVDAVHKGEVDTINFQHSISTGLAQRKNEIRKISRRVGTGDSDGSTPLMNRNNGMRIIEVSMELEETKLKMRTLKQENDDLRKHIANILASNHHRHDEQDENVRNHLQIIEHLMSERDDLQELLDKFLAVADQIIALKQQADSMKNVESEYKLLQTMFRDHQAELETLRNEKTAFEERIQELQATNTETDSLKETNSKLEKDLYELSNLVSVSNDFIHDQDNEIKSKLSTITELNHQIESLKAALSDAEMKLNKKLRLEMDVEMMEKELSEMIENSAESNPYSQQVIDRQVEDLATAIKLTLGCMNSEFESNEEDNLVEANRKLKNLLLESSNKILEFKDVINKQEQSLMKVTNDFACKNNELTECLATVEELKRQMAKWDSAIKYKNPNADSPYRRNVVIASPDDTPPTLVMPDEPEMFENEVNLADSPQISEFEDDGPEIEDLENIFEKSCSQEERKDDGHNTSHYPQVLSTTARNSRKPLTDNRNVKSGDPKNFERGTGGNTNDDYGSLQHKLNDMTSEITNLQKVNSELRATIRVLQQPASVKSLPSKSTSQLLHEARLRTLSTKHSSENASDALSASEKLKSENVNLVAEIDQLKDAKDQARNDIAEKDNEIETLKSIIERLQAERPDAQFGNTRIASGEGSQVLETKKKSGSRSVDVVMGESDKIEHMSSSISDLESKGNEVTIKSHADRSNDSKQGTSSSLAVKANEEVDCLRSKLNDMATEISNLRKTNDELREINRMLQQPNPLGQSSSPKSANQLVDREYQTDIEGFETTVSGANNADLLAEISRLKDSEDRNRKNIADKEKELETLKSIIGKLEDALDNKQLEKAGFTSDERKQLSQTKSDSIHSRVGRSRLNDPKIGERSSTLPLNEKVKHLTSEINNLQKVNDELKQTIGKLQQEQPPTALAPTSQSSHETRHGKLSRVKSFDTTGRAESRSEKRNTIWSSPSEVNELRNENEKIKSENERLVAEINDLRNSKHSADRNLSEMKKDAKELTSLNEKLLERINQQIQFPENENENRATDTKFILTTNEEMILPKISCSERDAQTSSQLWHEAQRGSRLSTKSQQYEFDFMSSDDVKKIEDENLNLKLENEKLVVEIGKLKNFENSSHMNVMEVKREMDKLTSMNEQLAAELAEKKLLLDKQLEVMPADVKDLVLKNEELRSENEKLLLKIQRLEQVDQSHKTKQVVESDNSEPDWVPSNEDLVAEIEKLQQFKSKSNMAIRQMEKDLKKLESINENLLVQLRDKEAELQQVSTPQDINSIRKRNEELKMLNDNLTVEIKKLKNDENVARSNEAKMREELDDLVAVNKTLVAEIIELKRSTLDIKATKEILWSERGESVTPEHSSHVSILQIGKDLERFVAFNESLLSINDTDRDGNSSLLEGIAPDVYQLIKKNEELKAVNETLSAKIKEMQSPGTRLHSETIDSKIELEALTAANERLKARIKDMERFKEDQNATTCDTQTLRTENENLKSTNDNLRAQIANLEQKLQNIENRTSTYLQSTSLQTSLRYSFSGENDSTTGSSELSSKEQQSTSQRKVSSSAGNDLGIEMDWMMADMKKLQSKNEHLRATNEKLLSQISELQSWANRSNLKSEIKNESEKTLDIKESEDQLIYASNRNIEIEWMKADMDALHKKNEKLKNTNESLIAEIGALKSSETRTHKNIQQMERDLLRLSAINERLSTQLNDKRQDKKQMPVRSQELLKKIEELTNSNECLASEITELKSLDIVKMRNDLKKLSSTNESLKLQISELKMLSSNDLRMESDWMAADMKKLFNRNKKLSVSNQNLLNEINELRKEFKSLENRANMNALQKLKEMEKLAALNETLKEQLNSQKSTCNAQKNCKCNEFASDISVAEVKKVHRKNEELKAANEKLLSVILNLKNSERQASSKVVDLEKELNKLRETNKSLQDTLENDVERDWSKPKSELEQICQSFLNEGVSSLTDAELSYMHKWFCKTAAGELDVPKSSRKKKKRLDLLKEIEETKLAIQHIQKSNDIEFDLNDVKNRLLKGKPSDQSDDDSQNDLRMSQSQGSVNVRAHIVTKRDKHDRH